MPYEIVIIGEGSFGEGCCFVALLDQVDLVMGRCGDGLSVETETVLFHFRLDFGTEIVHEGAKRVGWPARQTFVECTDDQLGLIVVLAYGLSDGLALDCGYLVDLA